MSNGHRVVAIWILLGLVAVACSTSTPIDAQAGKEGGSVDLADDAAPPDGQEQDSGGQEQDPEAENDELASAGGADEPEQSPTPTPSFMAQPDPYELIPFAPPPTTPADPSAGATLEEHIGAMFADVAATILADDRAINARMSEALYSRTWEVIPEIVLSVFAAQGSLAADVLGTIEAYARVGAAADYGPEATAYFEARASAAAGLAEIGRELYGAAAAGRQLGTAGRSCVAAGLVDEPDECPFDPEAEAIIANLIETTGFDIALPDEFDDDLDPTVDLCAVWSNVVGAFNAKDLELLDLAVVGSTIDASFLGRSECREPAEGLDGGPVWDTGPGVEAFQNLYTTVVQTGSRLELDEAFYDDSSKAQYGLRARDSALAQYAAIAETARRDLGSVQDPVARLALASIAVVATNEAWFQAGALELGGTVGIFVDLLEACVDPDAEDPLASCDPELQPYLERLFFGGVSPRNFTFTRSTESIEWRHVKREYELCSLWTDAVSDLPEAAAEALAFQMGVLDLDNTVGVDDCR